MSRHQRQIGIIDPTKIKIPITIIGAGGIGSWTALLLAKMGCPKISVYDYDQVEDHNVASQFYKESQLGEMKTDALKQNILEQTGIEIFNFNSKVEDAKLEKEGILIIAVDSMEVRDWIAKKYQKSKLYIIDGRMGGLQLEIYKMPAKEYPKTIVPSEHVEHEKCTERSISFNCAGIGAFIANEVRMYVNKKEQVGSFTYLFDSNSLLRNYER